MARERKGAKIAAQLIHSRSGSQGVRQLQELDERGFRPVSHTVGLLLGQRLECLLEAAQLERSEAFLGEDVGEAERKLLFIISSAKFVTIARRFCIPGEGGPAVAELP